MQGYRRRRVGFDALGCKPLQLVLRSSNRSELSKGGTVDRPGGSPRARQRRRSVEGHLLELGLDAVAVDLVLLFLSLELLGC